MSARENNKLKGMRLSPGLAVGRAFVYRDVLDREPRRYAVGKAGIAPEYRRICQALKTARQELRLAAKRTAQVMDDRLASIFVAQETMLADRILMQEFRKELEAEPRNAEQIVKTVMARWQKKFARMKEARFRERGDDLADIGRRLLRALAGISVNQLEKMPPRSVLVAKQLTASETVLLSRRTTKAVVVEYGGPTSHAALFTRELGIPAVCRVPRLLNRVTTGQTVLVDGSAGLVFVRPARRTVERFKRRLDHWRRQSFALRRHCHDVAKTADGVVITVMANVSCGEDVQQAIDMGAEGVGLYRLEGFYLTQKTVPSETTLFEHLSEDLEPMKDRPVTIRLLDLGDGKEIPYLKMRQDPMSVLGRRGVRLLLDYPDLLRTQLKAILQLSTSMDVRILVPMVTLAEDVRRVRAMLRAVAGRRDRLPALGAMIETPAAALCTADLLRYADFVSLGTNDLTQYTMAAGRENPLVERYFNDRHAAVLRLVHMVVESAGEAPVAVCGELAGNVEALPALLAQGIRVLSVAPAFVPGIKTAIRRLRLGARSKGG